MPQLLNHLQVDRIEESVDWGILAVFTCSESCSDGTSYMTEFLWRQNFADTGIPTTAFETWWGCQIAKRTKSKNGMQITEFHGRLSQQSVFWRNHREYRRTFRFRNVLGTLAFALKEIFKIIHHSSLFVWVLSESWRHSCASLLVLLLYRY